MRKRLAAELENTHTKAERDGVPQAPAKVGDMVFFKRRPVELQRGELSKRLLPEASLLLYSVQKLVWAPMVILENPEHSPPTSASRSRSPARG